MRVFRSPLSLGGINFFSRALYGLLFASVTIFCFSGCAAWEKQKKADAEEAKGKSRIPSMTDPMEDPNFQAFVGRLRRAVAKKDYAMIASIMTPDFGYRWDNSPPGETPFEYWDQNGTWPELNAVINERFVPFQAQGTERFMVAPPQFADSPASYNGYRAGIKLVNGAWKFVYFVPPEPASTAPQR